MNRNTSLCIERSDWMNEETFKEIIDFYNIEGGIEMNPDKSVIWLEYHDQHIFQLAKGELNILYGLDLWYDSGDSEIHITADNWEAYPEDKFYKQRTRKYDITEEI